MAQSNEIKRLSVSRLQFRQGKAMKSRKASVRNSCILNELYNEAGLRSRANV